MYKNTHGHKCDVQCLYITACPGCNQSCRGQTVADNIAALSDLPVTYFFFSFFLLSLSRPPPNPSPPLPWLTADVQRGPFAGRFRGRSQVLQSPAAQALQSGGERPQAHGTGLQHQGEAPRRGSTRLLSLCFLNRGECVARVFLLHSDWCEVRSWEYFDGNSFAGVSP